MSNSLLVQQIRRGKVGYVSSLHSHLAILRNNILGFSMDLFASFFTMRYQIWSCLREDICDNECNIGDIFALITPADRINYINAFGIHVDGDQLTL